MGENDMFVQSINAFVTKAKANQEQVIRAASIRILSRLVLMSPVDTGRFRGNWQVTFDAPAGGPLDVVDMDGSATIAAGSVIIESFRVGMKAVYFTNCLPYAYRLEYGHSQQAPGGMVRITAAEFQRFFDAAAMELKQ